MKFLNLLLVFALVGCGGGDPDQLDVDLVLSDDNQVVSRTAVKPPRPSQLPPGTAPSIEIVPMIGLSGQQVTGKIIISDPGWSARSLSVYFSNKPAGIIMSVQGSVFTVTWKNPNIGRYKITVTVSDPAGKTATATLPILIS